MNIFTRFYRKFIHTKSEPDEIVSITVQKIPSRQVSVDDTEFNTISGSTAYAVFTNIDSVVSSISSSGVWDSTYTTVNSNSATWDSAYTTTNSNSATWDSAYTTINTNSAQIVLNTADLSNIASTSGSWDSAYTTINSNNAQIVLNTADISNVASTSSTWGASYISGAILSDYDIRYVNVIGDTMTGNLMIQTSNPGISLVDTSSNVILIQKTNEGTFSVTGTQTNATTLAVVAPSGTAANQVVAGTYTDSGSTALETIDAEGNKYIMGTLSATEGDSSQWGAAYTTVNTNSASWEESTDITYLSAQVDLNTADITNIASTSGSWDSAYTTINTNSAQIVLNTADISNVASISSNWNSAYTTTNTSSGSWATADFSNISALSANNISAVNIVVDTISFNNSTIANSVTSIGSFMTLVVNGSSVAIPLYIY